MSRNYRYDHRLRKNKKRQTVYILLVSFVIVTILAILLINSVRKDTLASNTTTTGPAKVVTQASTGLAHTNIVSQPDYSLAVPSGWTLYTSNGSGSNSIITYRSGADDHNTRSLTVYEDKIPTTYAVNLEMPVTAVGSTLQIGSISGNCTNFTTENSTSSYDTTPSTWDGVNFLCNTPDRFDDQVGTGAVGSSINSVTITGPSKGTHKYFFLYIDRYAEPDYSMFYSILDSFKAK